MTTTHDTTAWSVAGLIGPVQTCSLGDPDPPGPSLTTTLPLSPYVPQTYFKLWEAGGWRSTKRSSCQFMPSLTLDIIPRIPSVQRFANKSLITFYFAPANNNFTCCWIITKIHKCSSQIRYHKLETSQFHLRLVQPSYAVTYYTTYMGRGQYTSVCAPTFVCTRIWSLHSKTVEVGFGFKGLCANSGMYIFTCLI